MATWPSALEFSENNYGWSVSPDVIRTEYASKNTRQRRMRKKRDDIFTVTLRLTNSELSTFETFVLTTLNGGADTFTGPYYTNDVGYTGTLQIVNGQYDLQYRQNGYWDVSFELELKDRDLSEEATLYANVNEYASIQEYYDIIQATEDAVNNNNLTV